MKCTYYFKNIRHVELGTYKAFDNNRVAALKKERGIGEFVRLDISPEYNPDVVADCTKLPFDNGSIDSISSNSLFEHVAYPHKIIEESFRVLSPGGVMQVTMPFFFVQHYCPKDYVRLSPQFLEDICKDIGFKEVYCHVNDFGGLYYTLHEASKAATINETLPPELYKLGKILHHNAIPLLAMCTVFDKFFYGNANQFFISVYCVAFKKGTVGLREQLPKDQPMLHRMLPYLVCPVTLQPLLFDSNGNLTTHDRAHIYKVYNGIPFLVSTR